MKVLVIAAHPDDEVIGCGGAIAKHVESGDIVDLLILTQIYSPEWNIGETETRKNEALAAAKVLGINEVYFGELPTVKINTVPTITLTKTIGDAVKNASHRIWRSKG